MATRESSIRLTLQKGSFQSSFRALRGSIVREGRIMGKALKESLSSGLDAAKKSVSDFGGEIKNTMKNAATLGGALSLGVAVKSAIDAETVYLQLGDALTSFTKQAYSAADAQAIVEQAAESTRVPIEDLQVSMAQLASVAGKADIAELLERSAEQARRLGMEGEFISRVYTRLVAKGIAQSGKEAEIVTEQFNNLFRTMLGVDMDEAIDPMDVAELAGFINTTGNSAAEMLKLISLGGEKIAKDFGKANEIVEEMGLSLGKAKGIEEMREKLKLPKGIIDASKTSLENMFAIADRGPKVFAKMADAMAGDVAGAALRSIIGEELMYKVETGRYTKKEQEEWKLRVESLRGELGNLEDFIIDRQRIEEMDARHKETASSDINDAMNEVKKAFAKPEMIESIKQISEKLPKFADGIAKVLEFVVDNPLMAMAGYSGLKIGLPMVGSTMGTFFKEWFKGSTMVRGGMKKLGTSSKGLAGIFSKNAGKIAQSSMALLGKFSMLAGTLGAAVIAGDAFRSAVIDPQIEKAHKNRLKAFELSTKMEKSAKLGTSPQEAAALLRQARQQKRRVADVPFWEAAFGGMASAVTDVKSPWELAGEQMAGLTKAENELKLALGRQIIEQNKTSDSLEVLQRNAKLAAEFFGDLKRSPGTVGSTTRGAVPIQGQRPGADPVRQSQ